MNPPGVLRATVQFPAYYTRHHRTRRGDTGGTNGGHGERNSAHSYYSNTQVHETALLLTFRPPPVLYVVSKRFFYML